MSAANNRTYQFRFDSESGQLTPNDPAELTPPDDETGPRHICFRPQGDVAYIVNEQGNTVTAHRYDSEKGTLEIFQNISTLPEDYTEVGATAPCGSASEWKVGLCIQPGTRQYRRI